MHACMSLVSMSLSLAACFSISGCVSACEHTEDRRARVSACEHTNARRVCIFARDQKTN